MQQSIIEFFSQILKSDKNILKLISESQTELYLNRDNEILVFSLKALHQFLNLNNSISYIEFRKLIYQSNINEALQKNGGEIEIHQSNGKVDSNLYKLTHR